MINFFLSYQAVESMRNGMSPDEASNDAILRILKHYENFVGAILAIDKFGNHGIFFQSILIDILWLVSSGISWPIILGY